MLGAMEPIAMFRSIFGLLFVIAVSCFVSAVLTIFGFSMVAIFTSIGFGVAGVTRVAPLLAEQKKGASVLFFICFFLVTTAGILADGMIEHPLWSIKAQGITLDETHKSPHATVFYFHNAQARPDLIETADIWGSTGKGGSHRIDTAFVVPIVPEDWTRDRPVNVWAVSKRENYPEQSSHWKSPVHGGARIVGLNVSDYQNAIDMAKKVRDLDSVENPLLIELSQYPEDLVMAAWTRLGWIIGIDFFFTLTAVFVGTAIQNRTKKLV